MNKVRDNDPTTFKFEKTLYTYGLEIDQVNGIAPKDGMEWGVFIGSKNITKEIEDLKLRDGTAYTLKLYSPFDN